MRRGLVHTAAWLFATGAAVTLSWWGVHTVVAGTAYDRPRALPIAGDAPERGAGATDTADPSASPSRSKKPSPSPSPATSEPAEPAPEQPAGNEKPGGDPPRKQPDAPRDSSSKGQVKSYTVTGGRVVFDLGESSASLVSATPDGNWQMQVWKQSEWIRVNFTSGERTTSVYCTWNGHPPTVQVVEYRRGYGGDWY